MKNVCAQNRRAPELIEGKSNARLSHSKQLLKDHSMTLASCCLLTKAFTVAHRKTHKMTDCTHIHQPRRKMSQQNACAHNNVQSLMASVGELQVVDIIRVWYLSITETHLLRSRSTNNTWCCYYSFRPPYVRYVRSQAGSSSFSRTVPWRTGQLRQSHFYRATQLC